MRLVTTASSLLKIRAFSDPRHRQQKTRKKKKTLFVHYQSATCIPKKSMINFNRNEWKRIGDRCSTRTTTTKHQDTFNDILRLNGHPENNIDQTKRPQNHPRDSQPSKIEWLYLKIPYVSERLNQKMTSIFRKEATDPVSPLIKCRPRVKHPQTSFHLHTTTEHTCTRDNCPISSTNLCLLRNAIYQITCNNCNQHYIGSTTRFIHDRVQEYARAYLENLKIYLTYLFIYRVFGEKRLLHMQEFSLIVLLLFHEKKTL